MSTKLPRDPKWKRLSDRAKVAYIEGICEIAEQETDGVFHDVHSRVGNELVAVGLAEAVQEGYVFPAYLKWNPSKDEIAEKRAETKDRVTRYRQRTNDVQPRYERVSNGVSNGVSNAIVPTSNSNSPSSSVVLKNDESLDFVEFYEHAYPRRQGRAQARKAWFKALKLADSQTLVEAARRFAADPNREDAFTPHPATWLNQERWTDDPLPAPASIRQHDRAAEILKGVADGRA